MVVWSVCGGSTASCSSRRSSAWMDDVGAWSRLSSCSPWAHSICMQCIRLPRMRWSRCRHQRTLAGRSKTCRPSLLIASVARCSRFLSILFRKLHCSLPPHAIRWRAPGLAACCFMLGMMLTDAVNGLWISHLLKRPMPQRAPPPASWHRGRLAQPDCGRIGFDAPILS